MKRAVALLLLGLVVFSAAYEEKSKEKDDIGTVIGIDLGTTYSW
jgi:heat shock protein 5